MTSRRRPDYATLKRLGSRAIELQREGKWNRDAFLALLDHALDAGLRASRDAMEEALKLAPAEWWPPIECPHGQQVAEGDEDWPGGVVFVDEVEAGPMTRAELEGLGLTDEQLDAEYVQALGVSPALVAELVDTPDVQVRRARAFEAVMLERMGLKRRAHGPSLGPYAVDSPEVHAAGGNEGETFGAHGSSVARAPVATKPR